MKACANLPYTIPTPVLTKLLEAGCFQSITVMILQYGAAFVQSGGVGNILGNPAGNEEILPHRFGKMKTMAA